MRAIEASLRRMRSDYIDILMTHYFDPATPMEESLRTLDVAVRDGKACHISCSNFAACQVMNGLEVSSRENLECFEVAQIHSSATTRDVEREMIPMAIDVRSEFLSGVELLSGLLTGKFLREGGGGTGRTGGDTPALLDRDRVFDVVDALRTVAERRNVTPAQAALAWLLRQPGARSPEQVEENLKAAEVELQNEDLTLISAAAPPAPDYGLSTARRSMSTRLPYT